MSEYVIRRASLADIDFLVETIIEAEKSGTEVLSYSKIFGLSVDEVKFYLAQMFSEEVDNCELSISSFLIAEKDQKIAAALSAWIEGFDGIPSVILKGNLINYFLPAENIAKAKVVNPIISDIHIEYTPNSIQIGAGYVAKEHRGNNLLGILNNEIISGLLEAKPDISKIYAQIFDCNKPSIRTYEKANFKVILEKESSNPEIFLYLPSNKKILMLKTVNE